jgi:hypothetical protein
LEVHIQHLVYNSPEPDVERPIDSPECRGYLEELDMSRLTVGFPHGFQAVGMDQV